VANVPPRHGEPLNSARRSILGHGRKIADHATRPVNQSHLDGLIEILDDFTQRAGDLKDDDLTNSPRIDSIAPPGRMPDWLLWGQAKLMFGTCRGMVGAARLLRHDEPDSLVPE
jgi:hypothetical protein